MAKTGRLKIEDVRSIVQLVQDCRDLGDDWHAWQQSLLDGLLELTDSELAIGGEVGGLRSSRLIELSAPLIRGVRGFEVDPQRIEDSMRSHNFAPGSSRFVEDYMTRLIDDDGVAVTNNDFYADRVWRRSVDMQTFGQACGTDATLICCRQIVAGEVEDVTLFREQGRRSYSLRDRTIVSELVATITPMMGGPLARYVEPSAASLPPRARQVLACFLEGDGDKQVAARLGISVHTVNQYAKRIFLHFSVQSRAELLARWIRRGWKTRPLDGFDRGSE